MTHTTHTQENAQAWREPDTDELVSAYAQACDELTKAQETRDTLRALVLDFMHRRRCDALTNGAHTITLTLADVRAFDVETLRELVSPDTFASVTRVSVNPTVWDKATKNGDIHADTVARVVSVARTDERVSVKENAPTAREFTPTL